MKYLGILCLAICVATIGKILLREYISHEVGKGVVARVSETGEIVSVEYIDDKNNESHITPVTLNVDVGDSHSISAYIYDNCSEEGGSIVRCDMAMNNIRKLCENKNEECLIDMELEFMRSCVFETHACTTLEKACALGFGDACWSLAHSKYARSRASQLAYTQKACEAQHGKAKACSVLGLRYWYGKSVRIDYKKAMEYYGKACDLGDQEGCDSYKQLYLQSQ